MTGRYCYSIYDSVQDTWIPGEFDTMHDCYSRIRELEIDFNAPNRFRACYGYVVNMED